MQAKTTLQLDKPGFSGKGHVLCFPLRREKDSKRVPLREGKNSGWQSSDDWQH
tara:strand:+ start:453 stop:611 length:159 start_codon:yes stop_codon:yes gene_type:complete